jgi:hypothetical protein
MRARTSRTAVSPSVLRLHFVHLFKKDGDFQLPSAVLKNATPCFRGKPAHPLE